MLAVSRIFRSICRASGGSFMDPISYSRLPERTDSRCKSAAEAMTLSEVQTVSVL